MKPVVRWVVALNAAVFFFGALLHLGVVVGPFRQPRIAVIVELVCGLALVWGAVAFTRMAVIAANAIAFAGIVIGVIPQFVNPANGRHFVLALDHQVMLTLIGIFTVILGLERRRRV